MHLRPRVLPPSIPEKDQEAASAVPLKSQPLPSQGHFMPSGGGVAKVVSRTTSERHDVKFMPSPSPSYHRDLRRTASYPLHKSWTLRGKLIFLGLVIAAVLAVIALIMRS